MSVYNGAGDAKFVVKDEAFNYPNPTFKGAGVAIPGLFFFKYIFYPSIFFFYPNPTFKGAGVAIPGLFCRCCCFCLFFLLQLCVQDSLWC